MAKTCPAMAAIGFGVGPKHLPGEDPVPTLPTEVVVGGADG